MAKLHATDFLNSAKPFEAVPVVVLFGKDAFLRQQASLVIRHSLLDEEDAEFSLTRFEGDQVDFVSVVEELSTMAMFGGGIRLIVIDDADTFVSRYRADVEDYLAAPSKTGVLVLLVDSFPSNTRLYKQVDKTGVLIDCSSLTEPKIPKWLVGWCKSKHKTVCESAAAELLVDLVGPELGLLDQELAKLVLSVKPGEKLTTETVRTNVGHWRSKTAWEMLDLALSGNAPEAIRQLDRLFQAGEHAVGLLAMISYTLRRLAAATELILEAEKQKRRLPLPNALEQAGVKKFVLDKSVEQLKKLGRHRGQKIPDWLIKADLDLKGDSRSDPRLVLEQLIVKIASAQLK